MTSDIPAAVSGTNDGTNWTSLTIGSDTYGIGGGSSTPTSIENGNTKLIADPNYGLQINSYNGFNASICYGGLKGQNQGSHNTRSILVGAGGSGPSDGLQIVMSTGYIDQPNAMILPLKSGPSVNVDIGNSSSKFNDLYLSGNISDGTNSVSVANIETLNTAQTITAQKTFDGGSGSGSGTAINPLMIKFDNNHASFLEVYDYDSTYTAEFDFSTGLTANRTIHIPNATGTLALTSDIVVPPAPSADGTYVLECTVSSGVATYA